MRQPTRKTGVHAASATPTPLHLSPCLQRPSTSSAICGEPTRSPLCKPEFATTSTPSNHTDSTSQHVIRHLSRPQSHKPTRPATAHDLLLHTACMERPCREEAHAHTGCKTACATTRAGRTPAQCTRAHATGALGAPAGLPPPHTRSIVVSVSPNLSEIAIRTPVQIASGPSYWTRHTSPAISATDMLPP